MQFGKAAAPDTFVLTRTLNAPVERVWAFFTQAEKRARWFTGGDDLTANGQDFAFLFAHFRITDETPPERWAAMKSKEFSMRGRVLAFEPPRLIAFTWGDGDDPVSEVRFEFTPHGAQTLLTLTHTKIESDQALANYSGGWTAHLETLEDALAGRPTNSFWAYVLEAHAHYGAQA